MLKGKNSEHNLVVDIRDSNNETTEFISQSTGYNVNEINAWIKTKKTFNLAEHNRNNPDNHIRIYFFNGKKEPIYVDDLEIEFEE